ncbi:MAG TPA: DNA repair protein RecO [Candidatus Saccharimonadales bacterium]|nr:DNA repair protein RecO [Candidatus Saccharimonadales bacterium]
MNQINTIGIILSRTDFGEADRIITLLTPDHGKLRLMAKGVRRVKSKLAGGIELFSVSHITYIQGRKDIGTLVSTRLINHYGRIVHDIQRVQTGYELIKLLNKVTEDEPEEVYFDLLQNTFIALDETDIELSLITTWFYAQLLRHGGFGPNLSTDTAGQKLDADQTYNFNFDASAFVAAPDGRFTADHIKFLRLLFSPNQPKTLQKVQGSGSLIETISPLVQAMLRQHINA